MTAEEFRKYILALRQCRLTFPNDIFMGFANKNPFESIENPIEKEVEGKRQREKYEKWKAFVIENIKQWDFSENIVDVRRSQDAKICYCIKYGLENSYFEENYLCENGELQCETEDVKRYLVYDKNAAIQLVNELQNFVKKQCEKAGVEFDIGYEQIFDLEIQRLGKPSHLFTYEELEVELRNGDDSKDNRLVIDADGYVKLIEEFVYPHLYPVRLEGYCAYNNYVGKYADLTDLNDEYTMCLQGWLSYLKSGGTIYMDYVHKNDDIEKLLEEIGKFY